MATTTYSRDAAPIDAPIVEVFTTSKGKPLRIRLQPQIYSSDYGRSGGYVAWAGVYWSVDVADPEEAAGLREALTVFFAQIGTAGVGKVRAALTAIDRTAESA